MRGSNHSSMLCYVPYSIGMPFDASSDGFTRDPGTLHETYFIGASNEQVQSGTFA